MSLLRNTEDNSINFQRASCTLEGCVKIWTSRVDSVGTEAAKLASNLAAGGNIEESEGEDEENGEDDNPKKKKTQKATSTLAKDPSALRSKKLELEFSVDPLFKKTSADFDEGGAGGLLMNHLSLGIGDAALTVVFDAGDSVGQVDEDRTKDEELVLIDIQCLRGKYNPHLN
jgi:condensin complex subunit 2